MSKLVQQVHAKFQLSSFYSNRPRQTWKLAIKNIASETKLKGHFSKTENFKKIDQISKIQYFNYVTFLIGQNLMYKKTII
jgi:hypothetical protein